MLVSGQSPTRSDGFLANNFEVTQTGQPGTADNPDRVCVRCHTSSPAGSRPCSLSPLSLTLPGKCKVRVGRAISAAQLFNVCSASPIIPALWICQFIESKHACQPAHDQKVLRYRCCAFEYSHGTWPRP